MKAGAHWRVDHVILIYTDLHGVQHGFMKYARSAFALGPERHHHPDATSLDQMLRAEVCAQVHNLPRAQRNQHAHRPNSKPLHPLIRALIGISQLHLPTPEIVQLVHHLVRNLCHTSELRFHWLQLLASLDGRPVLGVSADVDVQLNCAGGVKGGLGGTQDVLEADVEGAVGVRGKGVAGFAGDVARAGVVVAYGVFDL